MRYRDISIRKKILLSNFLMVLIPIIFVCFILFSLLLGFSFVTHSPAALIRNVLLNTSNYGPTLPVSYTHLDVYKRQGDYLPNWKHLVNKIKDKKAKKKLQKAGS